ncbi:MAG: flagellar brake protein [Bacillota bacterium]
MAIKLFGFSFKQSQKIIVKRSEGDAREFISSLEGARPEYFTISEPLCNLKPLPLIRGEEIFVLISLQSFSIEFKTRVRSFKVDNIRMVNLEYPAEYKRVQRRNAVRLKVLMDVEVAVIPENPDQPPVFEMAEAVDISAGGMEIITRLPVERDQNVLVKFTLEIDKNRFHNFCIKSKVRRATAVPPRKKRIGVEFLDLSSSDSDKIFRFIFKKSTKSLS